MGEITTLAYSSKTSLYICHIIESTEMGQER